jgi:diguanylate cyclase (GGDEF)-like protein/PAS domain S-box-containing protein
MRLSLSNKVVLVFSPLVALTFILAGTILYGMYSLDQSNGKIKLLQDLKLQVQRLTLSHLTTQEQGTGEGLLETVGRVELLAKQILGGDGDTDPDIARRLTNIPHQLANYLTVVEKYQQAYRQDLEHPVILRQFAASLHEMIATYPNDVKMRRVEEVNRMLLLSNEIYHDRSRSKLAEMRQLREGISNRSDNTELLGGFRDWIKAVETNYQNYLIMQVSLLNLQQRRLEFHQLADEILEVLHGDVEIRRRYLLFFTYGLLLVSFIVTVVSWNRSKLYLERFLKGQTYAIKEIKDSHYDYPLPEISYDELGDLTLFTKEMALNLKHSRDLTEEILNSAAEGIFGVDKNGCCTFMNPAGVVMLGYKAQEQLLGREMHELIHHTTVDGKPNPREISPLYLALNDDRKTSFEEELLWRANGESFWADLWVRPLKKDGVVTGSVVTFVDVTEKRKANEALFEEKERAQVTLHSIGDGVITTDAWGDVEFLNPVAESLTGWPLSEAKGHALQDIFSLINEETRLPLPDLVDRCLRRGEMIDRENHTVLISRYGIEYAVEDSVAPIRGQDGTILGLVVVFKDVTKARRLSQQINYQATHDALTGLINRREFKRRLRRVIQTAHLEESENALCYLDLDQFKLVNDTSGHVAGDELLRQLGQLLKRQIRKRDTLGRLGGDEFGLLMERCSVSEAIRVSENLIKAIGGFTFLWEDKRFTVGVSIGVVPVNRHSQDIDSLMSAADSACYIAKERGRNRFHLHQDDDEELMRRHGEMQWAVRLPKALENSEFELYYQPMVEVKKGRAGKPVHYEILLRMDDGSGNLIPPSVFLPAAERYSLGRNIDRWVIENTFRILKDQPQHLAELELCSINLSGLSLNDEKLLEFTTGQFEETGIPPEKICFEVTETVAIANLSSASLVINAMKKMGCSFALDDFGSGLSSFAYLKTLPVDFLKIDGLFVRDILEDSIDMAMVKSINEIGHVMGKRTIAEYVENDTILERLREIGVDYAQGYGIAPPRPLSDLLQRKERTTGTSNHTILDFSGSKIKKNR